MLSLCAVGCGQWWLGGRAWLVALRCAMCDVRLRSGCGCRCAMLSEEGDRVCWGVGSVVTWWWRPGPSIEETAAPSGVRLEVQTFERTYAGKHARTHAQARARLHT